MVCALLRTHAHRMLIGACNPALCPIHVLRATRCAGAPCRLLPLPPMHQRYQCGALVFPAPRRGHGLTPLLLAQICVATYTQFCLAACLGTPTRSCDRYNGAIVQTLEGYQVGKTLLHAPTLPELVCVRPSSESSLTNRWHLQTPPLRMFSPHTCREPAMHF